ncbi:MAG: hypothetical protein PHW26_01945 [Eubacteriales bacterium]|nr:hypothetical protein [Eubacteriales bacterium]
MEIASESFPLAGKTTGKATVYPIVQIRLAEGARSGIIQVVPQAIVIETGGELSVFLMETQKTSDEQSAG